VGQTEVTELRLSGGGRWDPSSWSGVGGRVHSSRQQALCVQRSWSVRDRAAEVEKPELDLYHSGFTLKAREGRPLCERHA
jgi:hypothetical protein